MASNFEGLINILPNIGASPISGALRPEGMTKTGLLSIIFTNAEELFNTPWWAKFHENLLKTPFSMFFGLKFGTVVPDLSNMLPGIAAGLSSRSK